MASSRSIKRRIGRSRRLRLERLEDRSLLAVALIADIVDVTPDPRSTPVQSVQINFFDSTPNPDVGDPVNGVDINDFLLTRDGATVPLLPSMLSPTDQDYHVSYALNLSSVTGIPATYQLRLFATGSSIKDANNNLLSADAEETWVVVSPAATITGVSPNPRSSAVGSISISFNESVSGVDKSDFRLTRDGAEVSLSDASLSGGGANYTLNNLSSATGTAGTYALTLVAANSGITDSAGNSLTGNASTTWVTDTTGPTASIAPIPSPRSNAVGNVSITFNEPVTGVDITDFSLTRNGATVALTGLTVTGSGANYTLNLSTVTTAAGTYVLTLNASGSGIIDTAGNSLTANASVSWVNDLVGPTATFVAVSPNPRTEPVTLVILNFNEAVTGVDKNDFTLTRKVGTVAVTVPLDNLVVTTNTTTSFGLDLSNVDTSELGTYTLTLVVAGSGITDAAGNALTATTNPSTSWLMDDTAPTNNTLRTAAELGRITSSVTYGPLGLVTNNDWYRFTFTKGTLSSVSIIFQNADGNLDMELYNVSGQRLRTSTGNSDGEIISLAGLASGTYNIRVFGRNGAFNPEYFLSFNGDDVFEENDTRTAASNLGTVASVTAISDLVLLDSHDWYRFTTTAKGTAANFVSISFLNSLGNLDLELYNASGTRLATSITSGNSEKISLSGRLAGTYYVHVLGKAGAQNPDYAMQINPPSAAAFNIQLNLHGLTASQVSTVEQAADRWQKIIVGDLPSASYLPSGASTPVSVDDLHIDLFSFPIDGAGNVAAGSAPDVLRAGSFLPVHGDIVFDSADMAALQAEGLLYSATLHEMAHVLGFGTIWDSKGLLTGSGTADPQFTGAQALAAYNSVFNTNATGVPVEALGGPGTADSHWRESVFGNELMTGILDVGNNPLSKVTIASMADLGYTVNLALADPYIKPVPVLAPNAVVNNSNQSQHVSSPAVLDALLTNWRAMKNDVRKWVGKA